MRILVLEDDDTRYAVIRRALIGYTVVRAAKAAAAIELLAEDDEFDVVMLDHDLEDAHYIHTMIEVFGTKQQAEVAPTGMAVVDWIVENDYDATYIVHSLNAAASPQMVDALERAGKVAYSAPMCWLLATDNNITILKLLGIDDVL